ncbi:MAG TPA: zf-HC2 domain-containing protein [Terriglobales bacterium]|nr:zf-HC2 domain-containing protein [Terriglobales bacterium]
MTEVPKIVYDRLRAVLPDRAGPEQTHPDADLLTAFAEQALSATERNGVLEHLALCGDCREAIALALPPADIVIAPIATETEAVRATPIPAKFERNFLTAFAWPSLRWAALAAGVAVAASVLLMHPGKLNQATLSSVNRPVATTAPPASAPQIAPSSVPASSVPASSVPASSIPSSSVASSPTDESAISVRTSARTNEARPNSEMRPFKKLNAGEPVTPSHQAERGMLLAENKNKSAQAGKWSATPSAGTAAFDAPTSRRATETVEVSGAAAAVEVAPSADDTLMALNETPAIERAKPALPEPALQEKEMKANGQQKTQAAVVPGLARPQARAMMSSAKLASPVSQSLAHRVTWVITGGILQRSPDSGQSWQDALRAHHPLLCYASHDEDVWAGGQAGTLFHSADGGVTWVQVQPSIKAQQLSSDVTHIDVRGNVPGNVRGDVHGDVRGPAEIVLSTSNGEIWSSADGGRTWEKK